MTHSHTGFSRASAQLPRWHPGLIRNFQQPSIRAITLIGAGGEYLDSNIRAFDGVGQFAFHQVSVTDRGNGEGNFLALDDDFNTF